MKLSILAVILIFINSGIKAQLYIKPFVGFGKDVFNNFTGDVAYSSNIPDTIILTKTNNPKIFTGYSIGLRVGKKLYNNIDIELGINFFKGIKQVVNKWEQIRNNSFSKIYYYNSINYLSLNPSVYYYSNISSKINSCIKLGFIAGYGKLNNDTKFIYPDKKPTTSYLNGNYYLGFNTAFSLDYKINNRLSVFNEFEFNSITYTPLYNTLKKPDSENSNSELTLQTTEFVESSSMGPRLLYKYPKKSIKLNNISFNIGLKYLLNNKKTSERLSVFEATSGISLINCNYDTRVLKFKYSETIKTTFLDINYMLQLDRLLIGTGGTIYFNTKNFNKPNAEEIIVKLNNIAIVYFQAEYDIIKKEKYLLSPNFRIGYLDIVSNNWNLNTASDKLFVQVGINNKFNFNNYQFILKPYFSYFNISNSDFYIYGLALGFRL